MNKLSTLVLVATVALSAPAFAQTLSDLRSSPFLAQENSADAPAAPVKMEQTTPAKKGAAKHAAKKAHHHHAAKKAAADAKAADAKAAATAKTDSK